MRIRNIHGLGSGIKGMTRLIAVSAALFLALAFVTIQPAATQTAAIDLRAIAQDNPTYNPGQVVVQLTPGFDIGSVAGMYGLDPIPIDQFQVGLPPVTNYLMRIVDGSTVEQKVAQLTADITRVVFASPNYNYSAPEAARPTWSVGDSFAMMAAGRKFYNAQWARGKIRIDEAHAITRGATSTGQPVIVAVLDTGIDLNHPAFAGRLVPGYDFVGNDNNPSEEGNSTLGPYGHGTHVAGLIAFVAPDAKIMPLRVLGVDGRGNAFTLALAVKYAVEHGADVINLSLSTPSHLLEVENVFYHILDGDTDAPGSMPGAVVVAAAGNGGGSVAEYPAGETAFQREGRCVLAVSSSNGADVLSIFSTRGAWVSVMAPGERIFSPVPNNRYGMWAGTSMASPLVAGEVALVRAVNPSAEPRDVVNHVKAQSISIPGQIRRIDVARAVTTLVPID